MKKGKFVILAVSASLMHGTATVSVCNGAAPIIMPPSLPVDSPFDFPDDEVISTVPAGADASDVKESDSTPENQSSIAPGLRQESSRLALEVPANELPSNQVPPVAVTVTQPSAGNSSNATGSQPEAPALRAVSVSNEQQPAPVIPKSLLPRHESVKPVKAAGTTKPKPKLAAKPSPKSITGTSKKSGVNQDSAASANRANVHKSVTPPPAKEPEVQLAAEPGLSARASQTPSTKHQNSQPVWPPPGQGGKVNILPTLPK